MQHVILIGIDHPVAPHFVLHKLCEGGVRVSCIADDRRAAAALASKLRTISAGREAVDHEAIERRLTIVDAPDAGLVTGADAQDPNAPALYVFLSSSDVAGLLDDRVPGPLRRSLSEAVGARTAAFRRVHLVTDLHSPASDGPVDRRLAEIELALAPYFRAGTEFCSYCLGLSVSDANGDDRVDTLPVEAAIDQVVGMVFDVKRRSTEYFSRYPLRLAVQNCGPMRVMPAASAAAFIASAGGETPPGHHLLLGRQLCSIKDLVDRIAAATPNTIQTVAAGDSPRPDAASAVVAAGLLQVAKRCQVGVAGMDAARSAGLHVHEIAATTVDLSAAVDRVVKVRAHEDQTMRRRFADLPGIELKQTPQASLQYFSGETGAKVLLIVNAFGLSLDFWQMLTGALRDRFKVIAIERLRAGDGETRVSPTYYSTDDYVGDYVADVRTVLSCEGVNRCHVVSWCGGSKLAIELAHALPDAVESLSFIAPSFAGMDGFSGGDSAYEKSLHTMCKIVNQAPKAAANMASSMMAIMNKGGGDLDRFDQARKEAVDVLELADSHHLPLLYRPFSSAQNMIDFSAQLMRFRSHDITSRLLGERMQLPVMLITGSTDTTTSSERAKDICGGLGNIAGFEIQGGGHYLIHQNYAIVAELLTAFAQEGVGTASSHLRVEPTLFKQTAPIVTGEL